MKVNLQKQVRMDAVTMSRVKKAVQASGLSESDVIRLALRAGLREIEAGRLNLFEQKEDLGGSNNKS